MLSHKLLAPRDVLLIGGPLRQQDQYMEGKPKAITQSCWPETTRKTQKQPRRR